MSTPSLDLGSEAPAVERIGSAGSEAVPCSQRILVNRHRQPSEQRQVHAPLIPCSAVIRSRPTCRADTQAPASQGSPASPATCASIVRCLRTGSPVASPPSIANSNVGVSYGRLWQPGTLYSRPSTRINIDLRAHARTHLENGEPGVGLATEGLQFTLSLA